MAEVIGVVSGAITFATVVVQLGKSISTLKNFCDQLNDAPDDIRRLVREIELLGLIVADMEEDLSQESGPIPLHDKKYISQCLNLCKEASEDLALVCTDLFQDTKPPNHLRRAYKSTRLVMQKRKIEKYAARLQKVIQLLILSQQSYMRALIHLQPKLIIEEMGRHRASSLDPSMSAIEVICEKCCTNQSTLTAPRRKSLGIFKDRTWKWRLSLPYWMTSKVIEVAGMKAPSGWNWTLRAYSVIPFRSRAVGCAITGSLKGLQHLFASGQASPFDQIEDTGRTLLNWVGRLNRTEIIEFLLSQGADLNSSDHLSIHCREIAHKGPETGDPGIMMPSLIPSMRVIFQHLEVNYETVEDAVEYALSGFCGTAEEFTFLQRHLCPSFYQLPKSKRVELALRVTINGPHYFEPELIRTIIGTDVLEVDDINYGESLRSAQLKLIHCAARKLGQSQRNLQIFGHAQDMQLTYDYWSDFCLELLRHSIDIYSIVDGRTLFLSFIQGYFCQSTLSPFQSGNVACNTAIHVWLSKLDSAGIDLVKYGETEQYLWNVTTIRREFDGWNVAEQVTDRQRVIGFTYGHFPENWNMWLAETSDAFVGQFWDIIERPVEVMPGAWPGE